MAERDELLLAALDSLLAPLAQLCVAHGLRADVLEERLRLAVVQAARQAAGTSGARDVSRIAVATGLSRREVARLSELGAARAATKPSPVEEIQARWLTRKRLQDADGQPRALPRAGKAPSFEALAQSVTRHVHPRSLLEEMLRLGLVRLDADDTVYLLQDNVAPTQDDARLYGFLGANVADHLAAAAENVVHRDRRHVEQAIFADELSAKSAQAINTRVRELWSQLRADLIPDIEALIEADKAGQQPTHERVRIGLYTYNTTEPTTEPETPDEA